ncbi:MAG: alpha/beta hydrolase [Eubacteriales bacterium]|nr:alpha/beta hydrolase [Eubacteriales bacterium]MDD3883109.1 alpha/beta hydrolase [Eubacteriales bacterium]MDD4513321.1 alpha/beta hydrolase [Eubacteriales bacterium]
MKKYRSEKAGREILRTYDELLSRWGTETEELNLKSEYGITHVTAAGEKGAEPLVLLHGVGDDSALMWLKNAAYLAKRYRIYAIDTIGGAGKSEMGAGYDKSFDDVVWLRGVLDALSIGEASFIGVSHGGYLAQLCALCLPERVKKAIALSASVPAGKEGSPMKTMMKIFLPEALFPTDKNIAKLLRKLCGGSAEAFTSDSLVMEHYRWLLKGFNNMAMGCHKVKTFTDSQIEMIRPRCYYLLGERDPFQKLGGKDAVLSYKMNARFYENAGHGLNHELADEINEAICKILSGEITEL